MPPLERFAHGTTVATNALLERRGASTAFVATRGFEHLLHLRRQNRAHLYRLDADHPEPLVPRERCSAWTSGSGRTGVVRPLDLSSLPEVDAEAIAVCLLFSFRDATHEQAVASRLRRRYPHAHVVASHEVAPEFREYERAATTTVDAYLGPLPAGTCTRWEHRRRARAAEPFVMRSSGGVATLDEAAGHPGADPSLGPGRGRRRRRAHRRARGIESAIAFDMGGTSTDVCLIAVAGRGDRRAARWPASRSGSDGRHPHGRRGRRLGGLAGPGRRPSRRPAERGCGARARMLRPRRGGADRDRRESGPRAASRRALPGGLQLDRAAAERALGTIDPAGRGRRRRTRKCSGRCGSSPSSGATTRATSRSSPSAGPGRCTRAPSPRRSDARGDRPGCAGVLSALGLVVSDARRDKVRTDVRPLADVVELPDEGEVEPSLPRAVVRATVPLGARARGAVPRGARGPLRLRRPHARGRAGRRPDRHGRARAADRAGRAAATHDSPARGWSSCRAPPAGSPTAGAGSPTTRARSSWSERVIPVELQVIGARSARSPRRWAQSSSARRSRRTSRSAATARPRSSTATGA